VKVFVQMGCFEDIVVRFDDGECDSEGWGISLKIILQVGVTSYHLDEAAARCCTEVLGRGIRDVGKGGGDTEVLAHRG